MLAVKIQSYIVVIATTVVLWVNYLATTGRLNNIDTAVISDKYPTVLTPAGYAFAIWSLIYAGLIAFSIYQLFKLDCVRYRRVRPLYLLSCFLNALWLWLWHQEMLVACLIVIAALFLTALSIAVMFRNTDSPADTLIARGTFGLYAGWLTAATLVNLSIVIKASGAELSSLTWNLIAVACLLAATTMAVFVRFAFRNFLYPLAIAWAATAIAVKQSGNTAVVVAAALCVIVSLIMSISFVMDKKGMAVRGA
ncbi:MAG: tryptophan-rich sensory protein [Acidobacteriota bacterium]|nr:MAG: tryptophan-rich sensory protein [Acidobacteriota bacterium]